MNKEKKKNEKMEKNEVVEWRGKRRWSIRLSWSKMGIRSSSLVRVGEGGKELEELE